MIQKLQVRPPCDLVRALQDFYRHLQNISFIYQDDPENPVSQEMVPLIKELAHSFWMDLGLYFMPEGGDTHESN